MEPWLRRPAARWGLFLVGLACLAAAVLLFRPMATGMGAGWVNVVGHSMPDRPNVGASTLFGMMALIALVLAAASFLPRSEVTVDEGGVRWTEGRSSGYVPYAEIADVNLRRAGMRRMKLVLDLTSGRQRELLLRDTRPSDLLGAISSRIVRRKNAESLPRAVESFGRKGRAFAEWLGEVRAATLDPATSAYRAGAIDRQALEDVLADERRDIELRAACAHVLATMTDATARQAVALAMASPGTPPLVVAAVAAARVGSLDEDDETAVDEASVFLDAADREALEQARSGEPRVRVGVEAADVSPSAATNADVSPSAATDAEEPVSEQASEVRQEGASG